MLGHQLRGWEKSHEPTGSQGPVPSCHEPEMNYSILGLSATQSLPSVTQPWQQEMAPATVKSSQAPCPAQSQNSCSAPQPPAVDPAPQHQWDRWTHVAGCQGSGCAAGMDCGGTQCGHMRVFPAPKWSLVVGAQPRTLAPHSQDQADVLCPFSQKKGAHSGASTCTPWAEWCQGKTNTARSCRREGKQPQQAALADGDAVGPPQHSSAQD